MRNSLSVDLSFLQNLRSKWNFVNPLQLSDRISLVKAHVDQDRNSVGTEKIKGPSESTIDAARARYFARKGK